MLGIAVRTARVAALAGLTAAGLAVLPTAPASAGGTVLTVTTTADVVDAGDGELSLREAVMAASSDPTSLGITLAEGETYELTRCGGAADQGPLRLEHDGPFTLVGSGSTVEQTCEQAQVVQVVPVSGSIDPDVTFVVLQDLTVRVGDGVEEPVDLLEVQGAVRLDEVTLTGQHGGTVVQGSGAIEVLDSTFDELVAVDDGSAGGILYVLGGLRIERSAITNSTTDGLGILAFGLDAEDLEISGNTFGDALVLPVNEVSMVRVDARHNAVGSGGVLAGTEDASLPPVVEPFVVRDSAFIGNTLEPAPAESTECCPVLGFQDVAATVTGTTLWGNRGFRYEVGAYQSDEAVAGRPIVVENSTVIASTVGSSDPLTWAATSIRGTADVVLRHATVGSTAVGEGSAAVEAPHLEATASFVLSPEPTCDVGSSTSHGGNVTTGTTCGLSLAGDRPGQDYFAEQVHFEPFGLDGPMPVLVPAGANPGLDLLTDPDCGDDLPLDQVGRERPQGAGCDTGAVEAISDDPLPSFSDVPPGHAFFDDISWAAAEGIADGFEDGTYRPSLPVSRQAMAAFLYRMAGEPPVALPTPPTFGDVGATHPFVTEVEWLADAGIAAGFSDQTFRPSLPVSRQAMAAFLYRQALEPAFSPAPTPVFPDVGLWNPFRLEVEWLASEGVAQGYDDGTFRPATPVSRQAMAAFLHRVAGD